MSAEAQRTCPSCGNGISGTEEFCPVCMLRMGLAGAIQSGQSSVSEDTVEATTPDELAQRFDHYELVTAEDGKPVELGRGAMGGTQGVALIFGARELYPHGPNRSTQSQWSVVRALALGPSVSGTSEKSSRAKRPWPKRSP